MKRHSLFVLLLLAAPLCLVLLTGGEAAAGPAAAGGAAGGAAEGPVGLFVAQKCSLCHSLASHDIERRSKAEKTKGPDLSAAGAQRDAAWIARWLKQEEKIDGEPHSREFKGSAEELKTLSRWLATLEDTEAAKE